MEYFLSSLFSSRASQKTIFLFNIIKLIYAPEWIHFCWHNTACSKRNRDSMSVPTSVIHFPDNFTFGTQFGFCQALTIPTLYKDGICIYQIHFKTTTSSHVPRSYIFILRVQGAIWNVTSEKSHRFRVFLCGFISPFSYNLSKYKPTRFNHEDRGWNFLRNVGIPLRDCMMSQPSVPQSVILE